MPATNRTRALGWIAALLLAVLPCRSQTTLREQLRSGGIPESSFSKAELDEIVDGHDGKNDRYIYFVYLRTKGEMLTGHPHVLRYDRNTGAILRSELHFDEKAECCGAPDGLVFVDEYLLFSFHDSPSASSVVVLDQNFKVVEFFYGFGIHRVAQNQIVATEDQMHFAPVHPERLQFIDLSSGAALEIHPLKNDGLRNQFDRNRLEQMPAVCKRSPELCDYGNLEEGCEFLGGDGQDRFAFQCGRSANYQAKQGEESVPYLSDSAIYIYEHNSNGWVHCERAISEDEWKALDKEEDRGYDIIKSRCSPNLAVIPDMSTSDFSPFPSPSRYRK
jgi:hypothetical protein